MASEPVSSGLSGYEADGVATDGGDRWLRG